jgi:DNA invertase Pin-like site-specific DNA recombinase
MKTRAVTYTRVSTIDQTVQNQVFDLRALAQQRGLEIVKEYSDHGISGARARRPGLDQLMTDARRGRFDVLLVWSSDRLARSTRHFLSVLDELSHVNVEFVSFRENIDTGGPLGRAVIIIVSAIAELEKSLITERVKAGLRRAKLEGRHIGRPPVQVDRAAIMHDRAQGQSLRQIAKAQRISRATVCRVLAEVEPGWSETPENSPAGTRDFIGPQRGQ